MAKSGLEACALNTPVSSCGSVGEGTVGTWEPVPLASHAPATITSITQLTSPQLSSHLKAAVPVPTPMPPHRSGFLRTRLEVYSLVSCFSACGGPSSVPPTLCWSHTVLGGEGGEEDGQTALTQRCVISQVPTTTQPVGARNTLAASESWTMSWRRLQAFQRPHCQHDQGKIPGSLHSSTSRCKGYLLS